jgi:hypothetical protein
MAQTTFFITGATGAAGGFAEDDSTMTHQPNRSEETITLIAADYAAMVTALAIALAIKLDRTLQEQLRTFARVSAGQPFLVSQLGSRAWLKLGNDPGLTVHREPLDGLAMVDFDLALASSPHLQDALQRALSRTVARSSASELLESICGMSAMPSRAQFAVLRQWSPLLEQMAYKASARIMTFLDELRPEILRKLTAGMLATAPQLDVYWSALHAMAHLILFAAEEEARPWLSDMASQLPWTTWTPTFALLRERTVWLAACAARSAVAFGEPVVSNYLAALWAANHPMKAFDALFGLVAIALAHKSIAPSIILEIRSLKEDLVCRRMAHADYFRMAYDDAIRTISEAGSREQTTNVELRDLHWRAQSPVGLATRAALCTDPASFSVSGEFIGFAMLPTVVSTVPEEHYCATAALWRDLDVSGHDIADIIRRAWIPNAQAAAFGQLN